MSDIRGHFEHLDGPGRLTAGLAMRPAGVVRVAVAVSVVLAWLILVVMARQAAEILGPAEQGPGNALLLALPELPLPQFALDLFRLCLTPATATDSAAIPALTAMWFLMALAMMLPSAAPMIRTYCEIADTAAAKGEPTVHPLVLVSGYLAAWLSASLVFAGVTLALQQAGASAGFAAPAPLIASAAALGVAGLYQFSSLKEACLKKCRHPFATLFSRWSVRPSRIFRLGVEQGLWCLGCCWALMLVMFAVGLMNIFWMALLAVFTLVEKQVGGGLSTRIAGGILLVWAAALLVVSL